MIVTVTANPSIDYLVDVPQFELGKTNRSKSEVALAGGKGINVSKSLKKLGMDSEVMGFSAGFTGSKILSCLDGLDISHTFVHLPNQFNRINVKLNNYEGTEINGQGPVVPAESTDLLVNLIAAGFDNYQEEEGQKTVACNDDVLVLSGSVPKLEKYDKQDFYAMILEKVSQESKNSKRTVKCICDTTGKQLLNTLQYHPWLIKPNSDELCEIFGRTFDGLKEIVAGAKELQNMGARNVLVSGGAYGGVLVAEGGEVLRVGAPSGTVVNAVGAGDSMIAGWIYGTTKFDNVRDVLRMAVATGSATAFSEGFAEKGQIEKLFKKCECNNI